jgi:hypothetical protein
VSVSQTAAESLGDLRTVASTLSVAYSSQITLGTRCTFDTDSVAVLGCIGHHMISVELCSTSSRLSLRSTLRASALTTPARSSKVALM